MFRWKYTVLLCFIAYVAIANCLECYECSWSDNPEEYLKQHSRRVEPSSMAKEKGEIVESENPHAKPYIGSKVRRVPTKHDVEKECDIKVCRESDNACLKWSFLSNSALNVTYKCVTSRTSGCFGEDVELKVVRSHLKKEVCLCNSNLCNGASKLLNIVWVAIAISCLVYILY